MENVVIDDVCGNVTQGQGGGINIHILNILKFSTLKKDAHIHNECGLVNANYEWLFIPSLHWQDYSEPHT